MTRSAKYQFCHQSYTTTTTTPTTITTTSTTTNDISSIHNHNYNENLINSDRHDQKKKNNKQNDHKIRFMRPIQVLFNLFLVYTIFSHSKTPRSTITTNSLLSSSQNHINQPHQNHYHKHYHSHAKTSQIESIREFFIFAEATLTLECENDTDCDGNGEKICHENKCMCNKDRPIEAGGTCLPLQFIDEPCQVEGQCLGGSQCIDGTCSCGLDGIRIKNPSQGIFYCHPKRQLNEQCNYDIQCPANSYCSNECLCQNGYAPANIKTSPDGPEIFSCLPITCADVSQCESSEFYQCEDNKCKCTPTHFDPTRARCYRLGSLQLGNVTDESANSSNKTLEDITLENSNNTRILLILNDLIESTTGRADLFWLLLVVIFLTLIVLTALCCSCYCFKRHNDDANANRRPNHRSWLYFILPCCFMGRKHHQEWDPADGKAAPPDGAAFLHEDNRKNNVNQKSFRRKKNLDSNAESADEYDDVLDPKSSLVKNNNNNNNNNHISQTSKNNDYQVIYFSDQKCKVPPTVAEESNQIKNKSAIDSEDRQFRINLMNGKANGTTPTTNGLSADKSHLYKNGTQNKLTNNNNNQQQNLDHVIVPTNSTLV